VGVPGSAGGQRAVERAGGVLRGGRPHPVRPGPRGARPSDRGVLGACLLPTGVGLSGGDLPEQVRPGDPLPAGWGLRDRARPPHQQGTLELNPAADGAEGPRTASTDRCRHHLAVLRPRRHDRR